MDEEMLQTSVQQRNTESAICLSDINQYNLCKVNSAIRHNSDGWKMDVFRRHHSVCYISSQKDRNRRVPSKAGSFDVLHEYVYRRLRAHGYTT